ncbi:beta-N-acetylhexosaminidase [Plantactinospora siamensis]|uniref:beta-N-acetylhexosaminidase n=1 Tax=Plantactinospora siamensis TaxID=555372 RepID=A0ABV6NUQ9_9ACTN
MRVTHTEVDPSQSPAGAAAARLGAVIPAPVRVEPLPGVTYQLGPDTTVRATPEPGPLAVAEQLAELLRRPTGYALPVAPAGVATADGDISLLLTRESTEPESGGAEGYQLDATADGIVIRARTAAGLLHGVQTLRQLLPPAVDAGDPRPGPWLVPGGRIVDHPRYAYRGAMLDVARHFFDVPTVCRYVDQLARYKINHLHLHLTDDQGWRIGIDSWPLLAEVGGASQVGGGAGGYYSAHDYRRIVAYAASRHLTVVPEIDVPGHTNAALVAYPELAPGGVAPDRYAGTDVGFSALAVDNERTYAFLADVFGELADLTPGEFLHLGGDEAFTLPPAAYARFVERVQPIIAATGKRVLGWHQIAPAAHLDGRVVHYWGTTRHDAAVADAVRRGAQVLLSPADRSYLDMKYAADTRLGKEWAGRIEVRRAYNWEPANHLRDVPADRVLGVESPLWTETVTTPAEIEYLTFPRLPAIAELGWSAPGDRDWAGFRTRLAGQAPRWRAAGITFHASPQVPWPATGDAPAGTGEPAAGTAPVGTGEPAAETAPAGTAPAGPPLAGAGEVVPGPRAGTT